MPWNIIGIIMQHGMGYDGKLDKKWIAGLAKCNDKWDE
jgi:hypothetical protein